MSVTCTKIFGKVQDKKKAVLEHLVRCWIRKRPIISSMAAFLDGILGIVFNNPGSKIKNYSFL